MTDRKLAEKEICDWCQKSFPEEEMESVGDQKYCESCFSHLRLSRNRDKPTRGHIEFEGQR